MTLTYYRQPTAFTCVQTAAAIFLSYYGVTKTPDDIVKEVPVRSWPGKDEPAGTPNQDIAAYLCKLGFDTEIISFDTWVTDLAWQVKDTKYIDGRLRAAAGKLTVPAIGRDGTELYIQAYLDFIAAGGKLSVQPAVSRKILNGSLQNGPIIATVAYNTLHCAGKTINGPKLYESRLDDIFGNSPNHNIVITRQIGDEYEFYDPWKEPGILRVASDRLIAAISTAQQECDNMLIIVHKN